MDISIVELQNRAQSELQKLFIASNAHSPEQRARVAWRASDHTWRKCGTAGELAYARILNNLVQDMQEEEHWPWVENLWSESDIRTFYPKEYELLMKDVGRKRNVNAIQNRNS